MRILKKLQQALREGKVETSTGSELCEMSRILESAAGIDEVYQAVLKDVTGDSTSGTGREGLSAERIVRLGIARKRLGLTYRGLAEASSDSLSMRRFLNLKPGEKLSRSAIHGNLKAVKQETWGKLNECLIKYACRQGYENGHSLRGDTTTVETNIHYPTDASLLNDCVRVLCRGMGRAVAAGVPLSYTDHRRRAKAKLYRINNTRTEKKLRPHYLELIRVARKVLSQAQAALPAIVAYNCPELDQMLQVMVCESELKTYIPRAQKVIDQAYRRVVKKESVPAAEKIFSIFEEHTDIIVKGAREVVFGHKISVATGKSCLILKVNVLEGNPKDSNLVPRILEDHKAIFDAAPEQAAFDGCFASTANRDLLKQQGVRELTFSKNLSMKLETLVSSPRIHRRLLNFRAGIEGCISFIKRVFSFSRVLDRSKKSFQAALQLGAAACNLTLLARYNIARALT